MIHLKSEKFSLDGMIVSVAWAFQKTGSHEGKALISKLDGDEDINKRATLTQGVCERE